MYGLFANEMLGMPVEKLRLEEIRQEIDGRRLANEVQGREFGIRFLIQAVSTWVSTGGWRETLNFEERWLRPILTSILHLVTK